MAKGGGGTTQEQTVTQQTSVTVQNVIQQPGLEPIQKIVLLGELFKTLDSANAAAAGPQTVVVPVSTGGGINPNLIALLIAAAAGLILVAKKLK